MKIIVLVLGIVLLAAAAVIGKRFLDKLAEPKGPDGADGEKKPDGGKTAQDIMPLADIKGSVLVQRDGTAIAYVKVHCRNNSLLNTQELVRETEKTATALAAASSWPMKIIRLQRPVDSTRNIESLRSERARCVRAIAGLSPNDRETRMKREYTLERIRSIDASIDSLEASQRKGGAQRTECYIVLPVPLSPANERAAYNRAVDMRQALSNAGIEADVLTGPGIVSLIQNYMGDYRTASQVRDPYMVSPVVRGIYEQDKEADNNAVAV